MRSRRPILPQRRPVFLGCEGESERAYGALLGQLLLEHRRDVHLDVVLLKPGAGDPLSLVELACRKIAERQRRRAIRYTDRAVLLDADRRGEVPQRDEQLLRLADRNKLRLIWQEPCHEALLLRHMEACQSLRPTTKDLASRTTPILTRLCEEHTGNAVGQAHRDSGNHLGRFCGT